MTNEGPLDNPRLREVEAALELGHLEEAQSLLGAMSNSRGLERGIAFLSVRLLHQRGRLDRIALEERLEDLVRGDAPFPEAARMLEAVRAGTLAQPAPALSQRKLPRLEPADSVRRIAALEAPRAPSARPDPLLDALGTLAVPQAPRISEHVRTAPTLDPPSPALSASLDLPAPSPAPGSDAPVELEWPTSSEPAGGEAASVSQSPVPLADSLEPPDPGLDEAWLEETAPGEPKAPARDRKPPSERPPRSRIPSIPRAPGLPRFTPPPDLSPSYVPPDRHGGERARDLQAEALRAALQGAPLVNPVGGLGVAGAASASQRPLARRSSTSFRAVRSSGAVDNAAGVSPDAAPAAAEAERAPSQPDVPRAGSGAPAVEAASAGGDAERRPSERGSGRYSGAPPQADVVYGRRLLLTKPETPPSDTPDLPAPRIRSGRAADIAVARAPNLFEIASLLDEHRFADALQVLDRAGRSAEHELLRARALHGAGRSDEALSVTSELCETRTLDPELRAGAARLMVELGSPQDALVHARRASHQAPDTPLVQLTLAWAAVRLSHRTGRSDLVSEASRVLESIRSHGGPHPGLVLALRACVHALRGESERAIGIAQRALALDPRSADAVAAQLVACARLGRVGEARRALERLQELAPLEAAVLAQLVASSSASSTPPTEGILEVFGDAADAEALWDAEELALFHGNPELALQRFEQECRRQLSELAEHHEDQSFAVIAELAARVLTQAPVFAHFAPYDFCRGSLRRVFAALDLLYDPARTEREEADPFPALLLVGAYLGQVFAEATGGDWHGSVLDLPSVLVVSPDRIIRPFRELSARLRDGQPIGFAHFDAPDAAPLSAGARRERPNWSPPKPWGAVTWPTPDELPRLGRAFARSVPSRWCAVTGARGLDGTIASLIELEQYLSLLRESSPAFVAPPWIPRIAVLAGAYLGEVVRAVFGAKWTRVEGAAVGAQKYRMRLGNGELTPVALIHAKLSGQDTTPLTEYVTHLPR
jgi:Flp pilus assembly protein TadD